MTDLRDNLAWIIGSIATAIAMAVGWLISSGVVINLLFLLVGSGITYFVQTRTQKSAWKREYSVKIAEEVYGKLYHEIKQISSDLQEQRLSTVNFGQWQQFQETHQYFMVDKTFRVELDDFLKGIKSYNAAVIKLIGEVIPAITRNESEKIFNAIGFIIIDLKYKDVNGNIFTSSVTPNDSLINRASPREYIEKQNPGSKVVDFQTKFRDVIETFGLPVIEKPKIGETKFNEFWESSFKQLKENETYRLILDKQNALLNEDKKILEELIKRIEQPWKI